MLEEFESYSGFIKNKYYHCYLRLANKIVNENRVYDPQQHEYHHVLPKSFDGSLMLPYTFKEHYIAHLLLTRFTVGRDKRKMTFSLHTFFHFDRNRKLGIRHNSVMYHYHRQKFIDACSDRSSGSNNSRYDDTLYIFKDVSTERTIRTTRYDILNNHNTGMTLHDVNALYRAYRAKKKSTIKGWSIYVDELDIFTDEIPRKRNDAPNRKRTCPHCNKSVSLGNYSRWHGDNCKTIDPDGHLSRTQQVANINKGSV